MVTVVVAGNIREDEDDDDNEDDRAAFEVLIMALVNCSSADGDDEPDDDEDDNSIAFLLVIEQMLVAAEETVAGTILWLDVTPNPAVVCLDGMVVVVVVNAVVIKSRTETANRNVGEREARRFWETGEVFSSFWVVLATLPPFRVGTLLYIFGDNNKGYALIARASFAAFKILLLEISRTSLSKAPLHACFK